MLRVLKKDGIFLYLYVLSTNILVVARALSLLLTELEEVQIHLEQLNHLRQQHDLVHSSFHSFYTPNLLQIIPYSTVALVFTLRNDTLLSDTDCDTNRSTAEVDLLVAKRRSSTQTLLPLRECLTSNRISSNAAAGSAVDQMFCTVSDLVSESTRATTILFVSKRQYAQIEENTVFLQHSQNSVDLCGDVRYSFWFRVL